MSRETMTFIVFMLLLVAVACIPMCGKRAHAFEMTTKETKELKEKIHRKFDRKNSNLAYSLVKTVLHKVNPSHINQLKRNWEAIPESNREKIIFMFEDAGLGKFLFLCLWESAADPNEKTGRAIGLFQITPSTAEHHCGISPEMAQLELYDPVVNAACAVEILLEKGAKKNRIWGLIKYHGVLSTCAAKGYVQCTYDKYKAQDDSTDKGKRTKETYKRAWGYVANALLHQEIGEQVIYKPKRRRR